MQRLPVISSDNRPLMSTKPSRARWVLIPSNATFDPNVFKPIDQPSWFLDLDMSISENQEFDVEKILEDAKRFSERIYTFFRWSVTEEFLRRFGGEQ